MRLSLPGGRRERSSLDFKCNVSSSPIICYSTTVRIAFQARRQRYRQIFVFAPPIFFLAPTEFFWEEEVAVIGRKKTLKFTISIRKSLRISAKTFFFWNHQLLVGKFAISVKKSLRISAKTYFSFSFLEITCFSSENLRFQSEKAFGFRRRPFFFWYHLRFQPEKFGENLCLLILILPPQSREAGDAPAAFTHVSFAWHFCFCVLKNLQKFDFT